LGTAPIKILNNTIKNKNFMQEGALTIDSAEKEKQKRNSAVYDSVHENLFLWLISLDVRMFTLTAVFFCTMMERL